MSKLKVDNPVPATALIDIAADLCAFESSGDRHCTDVPELHDAVAHESGSNLAVAVKSAVPKLSPETVTDAFEECGMLRKAAETTEASKLRMP